MHRSIDLIIVVFGTLLLSCGKVDRPMNLKEAPVTNQGTLVVEPNSWAIKGEVDYGIHASGMLTLRGEVSQSVTGRFEVDEVFQTTPENLESTAYKMVGNKIDFDEILLEIVDFDEDRQISKAQAEHSEGYGEFYFSTEAPLVDLQKVLVEPNLIGIAVVFSRKAD